MKYTSPIDPHVHLRWNEYKHTEFTRWGLLDALEVGLAAVMEMPNTDPPLTDEETLGRRQREIFHLLNDINDTEPYPKASHPAHYTFTGITANVAQMVDMFRLLRSNPSHACRAAKMFCCHSTGDMGLLDEADRQNVWRAAANVGYEGPIIVHAEDHTLFDDDFDPARPVTHSMRQIEAAESKAAVEQVFHARKVGFKGTIVFAHTSSPDTVEVVRNHLHHTDKFTVAFEVTWHHLFLNIEDDYPIHGNRVKMNPPLRFKSSQERLLDMMLAGMIDFIGTDHAPHEVEAKDDTGMPPSGIPAIPFWPRGIELLREAGMNASLLDRVTVTGASLTYGIKPELREVEVEYDPSRWEKYGWNPFSRLG